MGYLLLGYLLPGILGQWNDSLDGYLDLVILGGGCHLPAILFVGHYHLPGWGVIPFYLGWNHHHSGWSTTTYSGTGHHSARWIVSISLQITCDRASCTGCTDACSLSAVLPGLHSGGLPPLHTWEGDTVGSWVACTIFSFVCAVTIPAPYLPSLPDSPLGALWWSHLFARTAFYRGGCNQVQNWYTFYSCSRALPTYHLPFQMRSACVTLPPRDLPRDAGPLPPTLYTLNHR